MMKWNRMELALRRLLGVVTMCLVLAACGNAEAPRATAQKTGDTATVGASAVTANATTSDRYDVSRMDFKPGPAVLTADRHSGPFAQGSALSMEAAVKPLVNEQVK